MGRANTCSFMYRDRQLVWYPHTNKPVLKRGCKSHIGLIVMKGPTFQHEITSDINGSLTCFTLSLDMQDDMTLTPPSPKVKNILLEYVNILPKELSKELPPLRHIQHAIDSLLDKGLIQPNLSPCVVLALLAPKKDGTLHICCDSCTINRITVKYHFPIP
ncbi:unnamed protein product [Spirodela intermedia]|uniref:Uncharacterized protein n=1 Tax=Spirodela intermedia TaxID=51605 RepID=A0A7I8L824_SPIIN|nr:unnamed protein product [Spirodela intermedia]